MVGDAGVKDASRSERECGPGLVRAVGFLSKEQNVLKLGHDSGCQKLVNILKTHFQ